MLQLKKDNTVIIDLCDDTTPDDDTIHTTIVVTSDISGGLHYNTSDSDSDNDHHIIEKEIDNEIDKQLYYNIDNEYHDKKCKPETEN